MLAAGALVTAGCSSSPNEPASSGTAAGDGDQVTLSVGTFNDAGFADQMFAEYEDLNPGVTIVHNKAATSDDARANYFQKLGKTGLSDLEYVEVDWMPEVMQYADLLAPVPADLTSRWLDWKVDEATDADGNLIGYGTDVGPLAICYRADLFEAAGLPSDRDDVATLLDGDWANYFSVGDQYVEATGSPFFDSARGVWQGMLNQIPAAYEDPETGEIVATTNDEVHSSYDQLLAASATQSAHLGQWTDDWYAALGDGAFATMLCPGWMLGVIEGNAEKVTTWDVANVFPNGGGNWGGSYLTVPANGAHVADAQKLADWLTAPEQQLKYFANAGLFPSQVEALSDPALLEATNPFFNDAPIGAIFSDRAQAITVSPFKGEYYFQVATAMGDAIARVEDGIQDPAASWDQWVEKVSAID
ncbi:MAG: carbohydrate ABC transporter substrate-binding protein [Cellulomonadaceae bacterium]|nr:carbohydrate ABC transporter substrate-binding protein [Cellulomonadaceae bacterium]